MSEKTQGEMLMEKLTFKRDNGCKDEKVTTVFDSVLAIPIPYML